MLAAQEVPHIMGVVGLDILTDQGPTLCEVFGRPGELEVVDIDDAKELQAFMPKA